MGVSPCAFRTGAAAERQPVLVRMTPMFVSGETVELLRASARPGRFER